MGNQQDPRQCEAPGGGRLSQWSNDELRGELEQRGEQTDPLFHLLRPQSLRYFFALANFRVHAVMCRAL
jgi:hypothetical protein